MRTRLLSEQLIKNRFPHLRYVRVHSHGRNTVTIYAWNEDLHIADPDIRGLKLYASDYLHPYVCFKVKPYNEMLADQVPPLPALPAALCKKAMSRGLDEEEIVSFINSQFPYGLLTYNRYDSASGTVHFDFQSGMPVKAADKALLEHYLGELLPIGFSFELTYY